jgi:hypothetical protein
MVLVGVANSGVAMLYGVTVADGVYTGASTNTAVVGTLWGVDVIVAIAASSATQPAVNPTTMPAISAARITGAMDFITVSPFRTQPSFVIEQVRAFRPEARYAA